MRFSSHKILIWTNRLTYFIITMSNSAFYFKFFRPALEPSMTELFLQHVSHFSGAPVSIDSVVV